MESNTSKRRLDSQELHKKVWGMRMSGMTQTAIGQQVGCSQRRVCEILKGLYKEYSENNAHEKQYLGDQAKARLEELLVIATEGARAKDTPLSKQALDILKELNKLQGLYAPTKVEVNNNSISQLTDEELKANLQAKGLL